MPKCIEEGCNIYAIYNINGENKGKYCSKHKTSNMVNVITKRCLFEGCTILNPIFDNIGGYGKLCFKH